MPMRSIPHSHQSRRCCMAPTMLMCNPNFIRIKVHFREHEIEMTHRKRANIILLKKIRIQLIASFFRVVAQLYIIRITCMSASV